MILTVGSLGVGIFADDYWHWAALSDRSKVAEPLSEWKEHPLDLFRFLDGDPDRTEKLMDKGVLPWWTWMEVYSTRGTGLTARWH